MTILGDRQPQATNKYEANYGWHHGLPVGLEAKEINHDTDVTQFQTATGKTDELYRFRTSGSAKNWLQIQNIKNDKPVDRVYYNMANTTIRLLLRLTIPLIIMGASIYFLATMPIDTLLLFMLALAISCSLVIVLVGTINTYEERNYMLAEKKDVITGKNIGEFLMEMKKQNRLQEAIGYFNSKCLIKLKALTKNKEILETINQSIDSHTKEETAKKIEEQKAKKKIEADAAKYREECSQGKHNVFATK